MILSDATFEAFRHNACCLTWKSDAPIVTACERCGEFKVSTRHAYRTFCRSCSHVLGEQMKGTKNSNYGISMSEAQKALISIALTGFSHSKEAKKHMSAAKTGENHPNFGKSHIRSKQGSHYILLMPLKSGEIIHSISKKHAVGIPENVHQNFTGFFRTEKHRALILLWLKVNDKKKYNLVKDVLLTVNMEEDTIGKN
jgi:hypothetical protein